jgi:ATP-dependent RNA helicase DDX35
MQSVRFQKPGTKLESGLKLEREGDDNAVEGAGSCVVYNRNRSMTIAQQRQRLPIFQLRNHILYLVENYRALIVVGETGCGKTTQIPQYLLESGWSGGGRLVGVTQPRRVAVVTVAGRVAEERGAVLGHEVGYAIRFDEQWDRTDTKLKFLTDGMLIREMMRDPLLTKYSVVMLDEAHERTLCTDILAGLVKKVMRKREDLKLIVSSATLDAQLYKDFFELNSSGDKRKDTAAILSIPGRTYDVDVHYVKRPVPNYIDTTVETVLAIHKQEPPGDILAFLTGQDEVDRVVRKLNEIAQTLKNKLSLWPVPLYSALPPKDQFKAFGRTPDETRKVVVSTNIAETSVTIMGIVYVIDCGFAKIKAFSPKTEIESLMVVPISQSSAVQRAGRAGRIRSGKVFRLYTEEAFMSLEETTPPEMQRVNLSSAVLQLKALGIDNIVRFDFISRPPSENLICCVELLYALEALDRECKLTDPLGLQMAEFPLNPMFAKMLLESEKLGCSEEAVTIAAMLQVQNVFQQLPWKKREVEKSKRKFMVYEGDHLTLLNVYRAFEKFGKSSQWCGNNHLNYRGLVHASSICQQLKSLLERFKVKMVSCGDDASAVQRCIVAGFFSNAAQLHHSGEYRYHHVCIIQCV